MDAEQSGWPPKLGELYAFEVRVRTSRAARFAGPSWWWAHGSVGWLAFPGIVGAHQDWMVVARHVIVHAAAAQLPPAIRA